MKTKSKKKITVWKVVRVIDGKWYSVITPSYYEIGSKWILEYKPGVKQRRWCFAFKTKSCAQQFRYHDVPLSITGKCLIVKAEADIIIKINYLPSVAREERLFKSLKEYIKFTIADGLNAPAGTLFCEGLRICKEQPT